MIRVRLRRLGVKMVKLDDEMEILLLLKEYSKILVSSDGYEEAIKKEEMLRLREFLM